MKSHIPGYMIPAFAAQGVDTDKLIYAVHTDMGLDGNSADVYTAVDQENLYILYGEEKTVKIENARRIVSLYEPERLEIYALSHITEPSCEKLLTTARLWATVGNPNKNQSEIQAQTQSPDQAQTQEKATEETQAQAQEEKILLVFSVGYLADAERLIKVIKNIKENEPDPLHEVLIDEDLFCPKCGSRYPEPDRKVCPKCIDKRSISIRLMGFFKNYAKQVSLIFLLMLASTALSIFMPMISSQTLFDDVLTEGGQYYGAVGAIVGVLLLVKIFTVGLNMLHTYVLAKVVPYIVYDLKVKIFEAMQRLSVSFYTSKRTGALMNRVTRDANNIYWFFVDGLPFVIINILLFSGVILMMCLMNIKLALICLAIIPIAVIMFRVLWRVFSRYHHKNWVYNSQLNSMVSDSVNGQRVIKAFAREDEESTRFSQVGRKQTNIDIKSMNTDYTAFPLIYLFMFVGQVAVTAIGGNMVLNGEMTLGTLLTFIAYLSMLYGPLEFMSHVSNWWARCVDSAQRVFEVIDAKPDVDEPEYPIIPEKIDGRITVKNVWFEYDPATPILKNLNLEVEAGKLLGIVGKTGAGKSTLANLIARLYDTTEGEIFIDGINIKQFPLKLLRHNIGIVSQEIYLFIGSIADNIRYAKPDASIEEVIRAAKAASAHDFIMNLPDGYETRVGAGGQDLSGGEKQRLSIARTIIQDPKILILDEATAAMDTETEAAIQASLTKLQEGRTTISIAHRLSTLRDADSLAVISEGKVVETGTHAELMAKKGEYHKLYGIQMEGLKVINMD